MSEQLAIKIKEHNIAYRNGVPTISDDEYDELVDSYKESVDSATFASFRVSLGGSGGDVRHAAVLGSFEKVKAGTGELGKWIPIIGDENATGYFGSAKVDGMSFVATYKNGEFVSGAKTGDGYTGEDITEKLAWIVPTKLNETVDVLVRGELSLTGNDWETLGFKNRRNGTVGLIGRDIINVENLKKVKSYFYQIVDGKGCDLPRYRQFENMQKLGLAVPEHRIFSPIEFETTEELENLLLESLVEWRINQPYDMDGIVLCGVDYIAENIFLPKNMIAFKAINADVKVTVIGIELSMGKTGKVAPVVLLTPTDIGGVTVCRVSGYNMRFVRDAKIGIGAVVGVIRSGDVIPKIVKVYSTDKITEVTECPSCRQQLKWVGANMECHNLDCPTKKLMEVASLLLKLEIEGVSDVSLKNWGIMSFDDLLAWNAGDGKAQITFEKELNKLWSATPEKIFSCMYFDGMGRKSVQRLIGHYGSLDNATAAIEKALYEYESYGTTRLIPSGFGARSFSKSWNNWKRNLDLLAVITSDTRYSPIAVTSATGDVFSGKSFLFTGTISMPRKDAEQIVLKNGGSLASSVSKTLTYLVAGDKAGSKLEKAQKLGIHIITEQEFLALAE